MLSDLTIAVAFMVLFIFALSDYGGLSPLEALGISVICVAAFSLIVAGTVLLGVYL